MKGRRLDARFRSFIVQGPDGSGYISCLVISHFQKQYTDIVYKAVRCLTNCDGRPPRGGAIFPRGASRLPIIQSLRPSSTIHANLAWVTLEAKPHRVRVDKPRGVNEGSCVTSEIVVVPFSFQESFNFLHIRQPVNFRVYLPEGEKGSNNEWAIETLIIDTCIIVGPVLYC